MQELNLFGNRNLKMAGVEGLGLAGCDSPSSCVVMGLCSVNLLGNSIWQGMEGAWAVHYHGPYPGRTVEVSVVSNRRFQRVAAEGLESRGL